MDSKPQTAREKQSAYAPDTAGSMMTADFIALDESLTTSEAIEKIRSSPHAGGKPAYVYVADSASRLKGVLFLRDLIFNPPNKTLSELSRQNLITVPVEADQEEAARIFKQHKLLALPVVDSLGRIAGVLSANDISQIVEKEATEDVLKVAGIGGGEESFHAPFQLSVRHRLPWLGLNIFLDVIAVSVIAFFESTIRDVIALAVILPIISDMGGNVGIQTVSLAVRGLATGDVNLTDFRRILSREFLVGFLNGLALGLMLCVVSYLWKGNIFLGIVAGLALWINTIVAGIAGATIPLVMKNRGFDPATASGALLTTITDLSGFFLTLYLATLLIPYLT